ncbi:MAG: exodeoxyribonuclease V, partial [Jatrophihabitans sp.]
MSAPSSFDITGPLPSGTTVLEASAGTGKTHTIAALATRYVAEGLTTADELMIVTFGRAATSELRDRVRERFATAAVALSDPDRARAGDDPLVRHLAADGDDEVALRCRRLRAAVARFDAATISTTHGFCAQMLATLGIAADLDPDATFVDSTADLRTEVVADCYVREFCLEPVSGPEARVLDARSARSAAREAFADPHSRLAPDGPAGSRALLRRRFGDATREELSRRKRRLRLLDYDDLLTRLRDALLDPATGAAAQERVRRRYRVVLVDEFQDTDPVQWQILSAAFAGERTLVLIGDPKQAIYAFRGGDVVAYLAATEAAGTRATLPTNHRADAPLVRAIGTLFDGAALGDPRIAVHPVAASHPDSRLTGAPGGVPLRLRIMPRVVADKAWTVVPARAAVVADLTAEIIGLLESGALLTLDGRPVRPVRPADVAVLVHRNADGEAVRDALLAAGIPVVFAATSSVFASRAAADWLTLLRALDGADREPLVRAASQTCFVGWDLATLAAAGDANLDTLGDRCRAWADLLSREGVASLWEHLGDGMGVTLLARPGGERLLTDLRH